jgi:hypothetical protein
MVSAALRPFLGLAIVPLAVNCDAERVSEPARGAIAAEVAPLVAELTITRLSVPTYDGSGELVHPDVVRVPEGWHGWTYWMAFTPFPRGDVSRENPSVVVSRDGLNWTVPAGVTNPLVAPPGVPAFNSDPDLVLDPVNNRMVLLYREVRHGFNTIFSMTSNDGVRWSSPRLVIRRLSNRIVSPAVAFGPDGLARLWYVDAGTLGCEQRRTEVYMQIAQDADALTGSARARWSRSVKTTLLQPGYVIWHLDVAYIPSRREYWAVYPAYPEGTCGANELFFARSSDGLQWETYPQPLLEHRAVAWTRSTLYRASIIYNAAMDRVRIYFSGRARDRSWGAGLLELSTSALFRTVTTTPASGRRTPGGTLRNGMWGINP